MNKIKTNFRLPAFFAIIFFAFSFFLITGAPKASADSCTGATEKCMPVNVDSTSSTGYRSQPGYVCAFEGTCSGTATACCAPVAAAATPATPAAGGTTAFTNPLGFNTVQDFLSTIMGALQKVIVSLSLVMIVYGAVLYVTSGGGKQIETAKGAIVAALVGLAIGIAAPSLLKELSNILGWNGAASITAPSLSTIAINVLNFLLGMLGILSLIMLVIGATMYLTSAGDEGRIDTGKNIFKYSLIGVVIAMSAMVMVTQIAAFFVTTPAASSAAGAVTGPPQAATGTACTAAGQCANGACTNGVCN